MEETERERNIDRLSLICDRIWDQTRNPGMCPDQKLNQRTFSLHDDTQPTEPYRSGLFIFFMFYFFSLC